ncbi:hypothetical protein [Knoellia koreensis]|uniref:Uncharacterized protein n=1 Tax=Knoellia koreensis TaxID=2730921 RepID=A0A849HMR5_9MICO|nr:hypothetical protein [Knoellia sp. DB2414S]NNM45887.1 hypothetical protein [Knoellia sp. DB2414S]
MSAVGWWLGAAVLAGLLLPLAPVLRRRAVMRAATRVARATQPAEPGADWPALYARLSARQLGAQVGGAVAGAAALVLVAAASDLPDPFVMVGFVAVSAGQSFGALIGNLVGARRVAVASPVASLSPRELRRYLTPLEAFLSRVVPWVCAASVVVGVLWWAERREAAALAAAAVSAACLITCLAADQLAGRTLRGAMPVSTDGGLVWAEVLRATLLRDAYAGLGSVAAMGTGLAMMLAISSTAVPDAIPGWVRIPSVGLVVMGLGLSALLGLVSMSDSQHRWAMEHVQAVAR